MPDSLIGVEGTTMHKTLDNLAAVANKSFQAIVPWRGASTSHPKLEKVLQQVQAYSLIYLDAIEISVKTVQNGNSLGSDVIELYDYILDSETDPNDLREFLSGLQKKAKSACEDATKTLRKFTDVRESLNSMKSELPKEVTTKDGGISKYFSRFSAFGSKEASHRDAELDAAMAELSLAVLDLTVLSQGVDAFEAWCKGVERILKEVERTLSEPTVTSNVHGVEILRKEWASVLKEYERYISQIVKVQDQYQAQLLAPVPDDLSRLEINTPHKILNSIVDSAYKSMQVIEPWRQASSDHPILSKVIQDVHRVGLVYYEAIDLSINTAQHGFDFSGDAVQLCDSLLNPDTEMEALREYIQDMKDKAQGAQEECTNALNKFRKVRQDLNELTKKIPEEIMETDKKKPSIRIPQFGDKTKPKRDIELVDAVKELNLAIIDMGTLAESVDNFAAWWTGMETVLKTAGRSGSSLRPGKDKLRVKQLQKTWSKIQEDYKQYKTKIIQLQDYYPSQGSEIEAP
ncbi:hypothetical protein M408DRAFT_332413 [Serendipita vermifera MAFF 305830]|uniref:Uncharacterized protein n=1 Tax=Serendipita vermifera MAFF 305830 TaxID=933852 RepID=A0A0C3AVM4_SERVB|nr:hypothetical protein M408DRAFT_332413 [Serendipita vermifera MAFF 305830]